MTKKFIVIDLSKSTPESFTFWKEGGHGYTTNPWEAGTWTEEQLKDEVHGKELNDGDETVAVDITSHSDLQKVGLVFQPPSLKKILSYHKEKAKNLNQNKVTP